MSNLRWILLFSGFAILVLLYFSGRPSRSKKTLEPSNDDLGVAPDELGQLDANARPMTPSAIDDQQGQVVPTHDGTSAYSSEPMLGGNVVADQRVASSPMVDGYAPQVYQQPQHAEEATAVDAYYSDVNAVPQQSYDAAGIAEQGYSNTVARPASYQHGVPPMPQAPDHFNPAEGFGPIDPSDLDRPAATGEDFVHTRDEIQRSVTGEPGAEGEVSTATNPISQKINAFTAGLAARRHRREERKQASEAANNSAQANPSSEADKIVLLHVMTPDNSMIDAQLLLEVLQARGYHYGDLDIFHSLHEGRTVFSVAKVVEPGRFDINDLSTFQTPGLALILRLPGPVPGDVAFEVLMSEASELANALGCKVLDSGRSTLSRQTVQHIRESILDYMHRQRFLAKATT